MKFTFLQKQGVAEGTPTSTSIPSKITRQLLSQSLLRFMSLPPHELKPQDMNNDGICELQGIQRITGLYNAGTIGYAASLWKWQQDRWVLVSAEVRK